VRGEKEMYLLQRALVAVLLPDMKQRPSHPNASVDQRAVPPRLPRQADPPQGGGRSRRVPAGSAHPPERTRDERMAADSMALSPSRARGENARRLTFALSSRSDTVWSPTSNDRADAASLHTLCEQRLPHARRRHGLTFAPVNPLSASGRDRLGADRMGVANQPS
jgi:hypothetical protein